MKHYTVFLYFLLAILSACNLSNKEGKGSSAKDISVSAVESIRLTTVVIPVGGMTCTGCENTIKGGIQELPGIVEVSASFTDSVTTVTFDTLQTTLAMIDSVIRAKGYHVLSPEQ